MPSPPRPTEAELAILRVIWSDGPSTVRHVRDELHRTRPTLYTTVLKMLQIMTTKGLVRREEDGRSHVYHPCLTEERTQRQLVRDLFDRAFGGSASKLVMQALATTKASPAEMKEDGAAAGETAAQGQGTGVIGRDVLAAVGAALLHSLWIGGLIGAWAAASLRALRHANPVARYRLAAGALASIALVPVILCHRRESWRRRGWRGSPWRGWPALSRR